MDPYSQVPPLPASLTHRQECARATLEIVQTTGADSSEEIFHNAALNAALHPLRRHPALGLRCGARGCGHGLGYIAVDMQGAFVRSGNRRTRPKWRYGGVYDLDDITDPLGTTRDFQGWVEDARAGVGSVVPTQERPGTFSGLPTRRTYTCQKCGKPRTFTSTTLLKLFLSAILRADSEITLGGPISGRQM